MDLIGSHVIYPGQDACWEFAIDSPQLVVGLARVRDMQYLRWRADDHDLLKSELVRQPLHCGYFFRPSDCVRYWSEPNPNSRYLGEDPRDVRFFSDGRMLASSFGPHELRFFDGNRLRLELLQNELKLVTWMDFSDVSSTSIQFSGCGPNSYLKSYSSFDAIDRSEPLVMACFLRTAKVTILNFSSF